MNVCWVTFGGYLNKNRLLKPVFKTWSPKAASKLQVAKSTLLNKPFSNKKFLADLLHQFEKLFSNKSTRNFWVDKLLCYKVDFTASNFKAAVGLHIEAVRKMEVATKVLVHWKKGQGGIMLLAKQNILFFCLPHGRPRFAAPAGGGDVWLFITW